MSKTVRVNIAGDYAVLEAGEFYFYFGYEHVWCLKHRKFAERCGEECETEWAFTAKKKGSYIAKSRRSAELDEFDVSGQLIYGLGLFIAGKKP